MFVHSEGLKISDIHSECDFEMVENKRVLNFFLKGHDANILREGIGFPAVVKEKCKIIKFNIKLENLGEVLTRKIVIEAETLLLKKVGVGVVSSDNDIALFQTSEFYLAISKNELLNVQIVLHIPDNGTNVVKHCHSFLKISLGLVSDSKVRKM